MTDGRATYTFSDVISGTYILSLDDSVDRLRGSSVLVTVDHADTAKDMAVARVIFAGDINDDGAVNDLDLDLLFKYLTDWNVEVEESTLDVNGDGKVNNKDLTRLYQYLHGWNVAIF